MDSEKDKTKFLYSITKVKFSVSVYLFTSTDKSALYYLLLIYDINFSWGLKYLKLVMQCFNIIFHSLYQLGLVFTDSSTNVWSHKQGIEAGKDAKHFISILCCSKLIPKSCSDTSLHPVNTLIISTTTNNFPFICKLNSMQYFNNSWLTCFDNCYTKYTTLMILWLNKISRGSNNLVKKAEQK